MECTQRTPAAVSCSATLRRLVKLSKLFREKEERREWLLFSRTITFCKIPFSYTKVNVS